MDEETHALLESLIQRVEKLEAKVFVAEKKKAKGVTDGSLVWDAYSKAYTFRHGHAPIRNAKMSMICKSIAERVGVDDAVEMVDFYVRINDQFISKKMHPLGLCLLDCETYVVRMKTGRKTTAAQARQDEEVESNAEAARAHLAKKHG